MPRDGSGNYSLVSGYFVNIGDDVLPSQHNPVLEDIAQALTNSLARTGAGAMTGTLSMGNNPISNVSAITGAAIMATGDLQKATSGKLITTSKVWEDAESVDLDNLTGTVALDFSTFLGLAHGVVTGNITLDAVTNAKPGQTVVLDLAQDGTGTRTIAYNDTYWLAPNGEIEWDDTASARNLLICTVLQDGMVALTSATAAGGLA